MIRTPAFVTGPLRGEELRDGVWRLLDDIAFDSVVAQRRLIAPAGFVTDFDSTPRWLPVAYAILAGTGKRAAAIHDLLYQVHLVPKAFADRVYLEAMIVLGHRWKGYLMYVAVVLGGASSYASGPQRYQQMNDGLALLGGSGGP